MRKWKQILNLVLSFDGYNELLKNLLAGLDNKRMLDRFKALKRLSFAIFAANKDQYEEHYIEIAKKLLDGLREATQGDLVSEYFTLLRVLFCKFSALKDASKDAAKNVQVLWPHIVYKLIQVFEDSNDALVMQNALKLIEAMSAINVEDYKLIQWVFVPDCTFVFFLLVYPRSLRNRHARIADLNSSSDSDSDSATTWGWGGDVRDSPATAAAIAIHAFGVKGDNGELCSVAHERVQGGA